MTHPSPSTTSSRSGLRRMDGWMAALVMSGLLAVYACFDHSRDWNTASRLMLTYSLVQQGTIEITDLVAVDGALVEHPQTRDLARSDAGKFYCDKAPGQSLLGAAPYWMALHTGLVEPHPLAAAAMRFWPGDYWTTLGSSGILAAATASLLLLFARRLGVSLFPATATALAYGLATIALAYATLYYGHVAAGFFALLSLYVYHGRSKSIVGGLLAGAFAGCAVVAEYTLAVYPIAVLAVYGIASLASRRYSVAGWMAFLLGGVPLALGLGYYHYLVTGSPFRVPYTMEVESMFAFHAEGFGIPIGAPKLEVLGQLLYGQRRGLLWYSPVLLAAIPGLWLLVKRGEAALAGVCLATFAGLLMVNAGFPNWDGGLATGPRFLLPAFPLLMLLASVWLGSANPAGWRGQTNRSLKILWGLVALSCGAVLMAFNVAGARAHPGYDKPIVQYAMTTLRQGAHEPCFGDWLCAAAKLSTDTGYSAWAIMVGLELTIAAALLWIAWRIDRRPKQEGAG